ncbi:hypothetical protein K438DRAFT_1768729 [Mycena galopus ATCC 62051]|nr:hypothetical protein K438DRAFT_1768729 [Mycena galopus ATCC 62051]
MSPMSRELMVQTAEIKKSKLKTNRDHPADRTGTTDIPGTLSPSTNLDNSLAATSLVTQQGFSADVSCQFEDLTPDTTPSLSFEVDPLPGGVMSVTMNSNCDDTTAAATTIVVANQTVLPGSGFISLLYEVNADLDTAYFESLKTAREMMPQGAWGAELIAPTTARSATRAARWDTAVNPDGTHVASLELAGAIRTSASWGRRAVLEGREDSDPYDVNGPAQRAFQLSEALIHAGDVPATDPDCCPCLVSHPHASPVLLPTPQRAVCAFVSIEEVAGGDDGGRREDRVTPSPERAVSVLLRCVVISEKEPKCAGFCENVLGFLACVGFEKCVAVSAVVYPPITMVCTLTPKVTYVNVESTYSFSGGTISATTLPGGAPAASGAPGMSAITTITDLVYFSQAVQTNIMGDQLKSVLQYASGNLIDDPRNRTEDYLRGVAEYSGSVFRACLSARGGGLSAEGVPQSMTTLSSGKFEAQFFGWEFTLSSSWVLIPGTLVAFATLYAVFLTFLLPPLDPRAKPINPANTMHLVSAAAAGGLADVLTGTDQDKGVHIGVGAFDGLEPAFVKM